MRIEALKARDREERGSTAARRMRRLGEVPANLAGVSAEPRSLAVSAHDLEVIQRSGAQLVTLQFGEDEVEALIREVQLDTFGDKVLHVDFEEIQRGHTIQVDVPLDIVGTPIGQTQGGLFRILLDAVNVACMPRHIPDKIEVDVRELEAGQDIRASALGLPEGVALGDTGEDDIIAIVDAPVVVEDEEEEEGILAETDGDAASEPEVISKGKEEEED